MGRVNRTIAVQTSQGINTRLHWKKYLKPKGWRYGSSGRVPARHWVQTPVLHIYILEEGEVL
jgi:hypothetical protein